MHNSLLSVMGPWPWYVLGGTALGLVLLLLVDGLTRAFGGVADSGRGAGRLAVR